MSKALLISGATGKQGGAVINALIQDPASSNLTIYALTRDPNSGSAAALAKKSSNIKLVQGNLDDVPAIFKSIDTQIHRVFSIQAPPGQGQSLDAEEIQGKALVDGALANGVTHFVYTSVDRHGARSPENPTHVPHFITKHNVEKHLEKATESGEKMSYTILRPVAFMDNFGPDFMGKAMGGMMFSIKPETKLQLIATSDIGYFGAQALLHPEQYKNQAISLAGDDLTYGEIKSAFEKTMGYPLPSSSAEEGKQFLQMSDDMNHMFQWFDEEGYGVDIAALKKKYSGLKSWTEWLKSDSSYEKK